MDTTVPACNADFRYLKDFGGLELLHYRYDGAVYSRHVHEGYAIHVIDSGVERFHCLGASHLAGPGDIVMVNADTVHDGHEAAEGCRYRGFYPPTSLMDNLTRDIHGNGLPWFPQPVVRNPRLAERLRGLITLLGQNESRLHCDNAWLEVMSDLLQQHGRQRLDIRAPAPARTAIDRVRDYLDAHYADNPSLADLARLAGLSPHYLNRLFQRQVGLPPHAYLVQRRLMRARQLIRAGRSPLEASLESGFSDQSHLHRHFKRAQGLTPGQYHQAITRAE